MASEQRIVTFRGNVQGVGFRFTACRVAEAHDITGYVRNLPDGSVQVVVEGDSPRINAFLADLEERMSGYICGRSQQIAPASGRYTSFGVKF